MKSNKSQNIKLKSSVPTTYEAQTRHNAEFGRKVFPRRSFWSETQMKERKCWIWKRTVILATKNSNSLHKNPKYNKPPMPKSWVPLNFNLQSQNKNNFFEKNGNNIATTHKKQEANDRKFEQTQANIANADKKNYKKKN